jgi:hypothetical protein
MSDLGRFAIRARSAALYLSIEKRVEKRAIILARLRRIWKIFPAPRAVGRGQ